MKIIREHKDAYRDLLKAWADGESATVLSSPVNASCLDYDGPPALVTWTSGTTGLPKGVVVPWTIVAERCHTSFGLYGGADALNVSLSLRGQGVGKLMPAVLGMTVSDVGMDDYSAALEALPRDAVTCLFAMPCQIKEMLTVGRPGPLPHLRKVILAGEAMDAVEHAHIVEQFGVPVFNCYGATETGTIAISDGITPDLRPVVEMRFVSGLIEVKTPLLASLRVGSPMPVNDGWYRTGDEGHIDDGRLIITGRSKVSTGVHGYGCPIRTQSSRATKEMGHERQT